MCEQMLPAHLGYTWLGPESMDLQRHIEALVSIREEFLIEQKLRVITNVGADLDFNKHINNNLALYDLY